MAETDIAIVGFGCRLPGARDPAEFWQLLRDGREARQEFTDDQLRAAGVSEEQLRDPHWVKAGMVLADIDRFDAPFFGFSPQDAAIMDPQHRVFLEVAWEAFEHAGHVPDAFAGRVGVFAGCGMNTYLLHNILTNRDLVQRIGMFLIRHTGNDKDFLATRVSYEFDLRGPSVNVLTACSTSLVAIHQAAQSLLAGECDLALAGGVTILVPQDRGYRYEDGEILAPDGRCRAFDADSKGTIFGSGAGVVVLRRLQDALADGDRIHAVLAGSAVNNDGARKVGYLAPSVDGYAEVVAEALTLANVTADQVQYVEAHGTGTPVGDPIEIEALTQAFRVTSRQRGTCGIGSVKTNIGHLDTAAGIAGLLKVVLAMQHGWLPASLNWRAPNPLIDFDSTPFTVVDRARDWPQPAQGRIAGVSSLGVGGTNAHVIVRQAPDVPASAPPPRRAQLLPLSGKNADAALAAAARLALHLDGVSQDQLADVSWTLQGGRKAFAHRLAVAGTTPAELAAALRGPGLRNQLRKVGANAPAVVFLFPGGGAQYPGMGKGLYEHEPAFRAAADECLLALPPTVAVEVRDLLFGDSASAVHGERLERPSLALPALFTVEYATARALMAFGVEPVAMLGHSMGEYVAACLAGTFTVAQAMQIVLLRGQLFEQVAAGAMLTVSLPVDQVAALTEAELSLAAANAPSLAVVAGTVPAIDRLQRRLEERGVDCQRLRIAVAAHSHLLDPILEPFAAGLRAMRFQPASKPFLSNVTGDWIDPGRAASPEYWVEHLRRTVRFQDAAARLLERNDCVFVEVGPGKALTSLVRMHERGGAAVTCTSLPHAKDTVAADVVLLECVGRLWQAGVEVDWRRLQGPAPRRRVPLPTYPFQRQRHWIEPGNASLAPVAATVAPPTRLPTSAWLRRPTFEASELPGSVTACVNAHWLVLGDGHGLAAALATQVRAGGGAATIVARDADLAAALGAIDPKVPLRVLHLGALDGLAAIAAVQELVRCTQALGRLDRAATCRMLGVTCGAMAVGDEPVERPDGAAIGAFLRVAMVEYQGLQAHAIDVEDVEPGSHAALLPLLVREIEAAPAAVAVRAQRRLVQMLVPVAEPGTVLSRSPWRQEGVYLLSGGLGGVGLQLAEHLATQHRARLVLVGRRGLPVRSCHDEWLQLRGDDRIGASIRRIRAMEAAGARVEVVAGDIADPATVQAAIALAHDRFGGLHGIVHCAGVLDDGLIQVRTPAQIENVMAAKVLGARALDAASAAAMPELFVLFSSVSGLAAIPGQGDYAAANAVLDAFAAWRRAQRPGRTLAIDWGVWAGAGMLAERAPSTSTTTVGDEPLLGRHAASDGVHRFERSVSPAQDWELAEHRLADGRALLPGTAWLERLMVAARTVTGQRACTLRRFELRAPLLVGDADRALLCTEVRHDAGGLAIAIESVAADGTRTLHATATATSGAAGGDVPFPDWWQDGAAPAAGRAQQGRHVRFGPRWQNVVRTASRAGMAVAELALPAPFAADLATHPQHPALLDMALGIALPLLDRGEDLLFVPVGCDEIRVFGALPARVLVRAQCRGYDAHARLGSFDLVFGTPSGIPLLELRGLQVYGVVGGAMHAAAAAPVATRTVVAPPPAPAMPIAGLVARGITPAEGWSALATAWATGLTQVVVSPFEVAEAAAWLARPPERPRAQPVLPASAEASPATATAGPRDEVERRLCAQWHELLGVGEPDLDLDFFVAGGHSLLAVRLFARLHRDHGVDLELSTLLGAGTPRKLATVLRQHLQLPEPDAQLPAATSSRKFQFLVPIRAEGARPPLYLVHGAGGNVLGFRDLAHYFGADQPVFGLQARGVDGRTPPHASIEAMARDYLAEIRMVQPTGPFYLGGYSGGGCVALEMAQLLVAAGEAVPFVGMIDTWAPDAPERSKLARVGIHVARLLRRGPGYPLGILRQRRAAKVAAREHEQKVAAGGNGAALPPELRGHELQNAFERAFFRYQPRAYAGKVWLFTAEREDHTKYVHTPDLGWARHVPAIVTDQCPGDHFSMCTEPNVQLLCARYRAAMDAAMLAAATRR